MTITDVVGDMFTRLRNSVSSGGKTVDIPASQLKERIARLLKEEGYLAGYEMIGAGTQKIIRLTLKFFKGRNVIAHIQRVSRPGCRVYWKAGQIFPIRDGYGIAIISTSKGLMTDSDAKKQKLGGEVLGLVW